MGALDDRDLAAEIALLGEVMAAVAAAAQELSDAEVDEMLGVAPPAGEPREPGEPGGPGESGGPGGPKGSGRPTRPGRSRVSYGRLGQRGGAGGG